MWKYHPPTCAVRSPGEDSVAMAPASQAWLLLPRHLAYGTPCGIVTVPDPKTAIVGTAAAAAADDTEGPDRIDAPAELLPEDDVLPPDEVPPLLLTPPPLKLDAAEKMATPQMPPKLQLRLPSSLTHVISSPPQSTATRRRTVAALLGGTVKSETS